MLRFILNPLLVKEAELERRPDGWPEKIFRFALYYFFTAAVCIGILLRFWDWKTIEQGGGFVGSVLRGMMGPCFIYMLNYMVWRFVKNPVIRYVWLGLMISFAILFVILTISTP